MKTVLESIDTRYGTDNTPHYSNGNTLPYTGVPFGMNYFVPQTSHLNGAWYFNPTIPIFQGIRLTHQPSPWIGDFSWLLLTPVTEKVEEEDLLYRQSSYLVSEATFQPHYLKLYSNRYQLSTEITPSLYGAKLRFTSLENKKLSLLFHTSAELHIKQLNPHSIFLKIIEETNTTKRPLIMHLCLQFSQVIQKISRLGTDWCLDFNTEILETTLATSFISSDQAQFNLPSGTFEEIKESAETNWKHYLNRFDIVEQGEADRHLFDHALYRLFLFPQTFYEINKQGQEIHLNLKKQHVESGKLYTNIGFWDSFRTNFPLLALVAPEKYHDFLEGFLHFYHENGFLPKWLAPDERGMMPGTLIDGVIADGAIKDLIPDFEQELLQAMIKTATIEDPAQIYGRHGTEDYQKLGYLPIDYHESVSHSLDYSYSDFCISILAKKLGYKKEAQNYARQALNYKQLFDSQTGYIRPKDRQGNFKAAFSPYSWGKDYAECSAIQNTVGILHDIEGLKELMGGEKIFTSYLIKLCNDTPHFEIGGYGFEIHEMSEMATARFGQLAISNQPSFHIPYLFRYSAHPEYTSLILKSIRNQAFRPNFQAFPGDEDNGSLSAWYIWSALGLYPTCPGKADYDLGTPLFNHLRIYLPQAMHWLDIRSHHNYSHFHFVKDVRLDKKQYTRISHHELLSGKELDFYHSWLP